MPSPTLAWLIAGVILCIMELVVPTAFVEFIMGISAIGVAVVSLIVPYLALQVLLWLVLSTLLIWLSRRFLTPRRRVSDSGDDREGETLTEILPGKAGRILYEGNSWRAKCEDDLMAIAPHQKVYIVRREGNTLIVLPYNIFYP
jgi:membrane protein implicated in regulation of membrane protease activity